MTNLYAICYLFFLCHFFFFHKLICNLKWNIWKFPFTSWLFMHSLGIITSEVKCFILNNLFFNFSSVQSLSCVRLFVTSWITACQAPLSITSSQSLLKLMSVESVMPSIHLILCCPLLLLPPIPLSIRVFSNKPTLCISLLKEKSWVVLFPWEKVQTWQPKPFPQFH